jgi:O-antigen/teichoic acid export membrane protein
MTVIGRDLLFSGVLRPPADLGWQALISLPSFFATHFMGLEYGGAIAFGTNLVTGLSVPFSGAGLVLLPMASRLVQEGRLLILKRKSLLLILVILFAGIPVTLLGEYLAELIVLIVLGLSSNELVLVIRIMLPSLIPISLFVTLQHVVDGACKSYVNSRNVVISLIVYNSTIPLARYMFPDPYGLVSSWFVSLVALAVLTIGSIWNETKSDLVC